VVKLKIARMSQMGSKADIETQLRSVRFTPDSGLDGRWIQVRFVPFSDLARLYRRRSRRVVAALRK
jgi:hypothetical protein